MARDTKEKFDLYEENEVREYWIVSPGDRSVTVYVLKDGRYQVHGEFYTPGSIPVHVLPECSIEWGEIFEGLQDHAGPYYAAIPTAAFVFFAITRLKLIE